MSGDNKPATLLGRSARPAHAVAQIGAVGLGLAALALRPVSPTGAIITALVGMAGAAPALRLQRAAHGRAGRGRWIAVTATGCGAFALGRLVSGTPGFRPTALGITALMIAAIAEELFFRRFVYGLLERHSTALAVGVSAVMFALVHLPMYGVRAMPIDLAAGLLLSWQRWASGSVTSPMLSHMFVNLIQVGWGG